MAINVVIYVPPNGQQVPFSPPPPELVASGTVDALPLRMAYQIDDGALTAMDVNQLHQIQGQQRWGWSITLTATDCPNQNTWYALVVFAYDDAGSYSQTSDFYRTT
jgi:hypothetical protein